MIIDNIIANGEYEVGDFNNANYEKYTFTFNKNSGELEINLQAAPYGKFPSNSEEEQKKMQIEKRRSMIKKLTDDLYIILGLPDDQNTDLFHVDLEWRKLTIKPKSFENIAKYINRRDINRPELLYIGMNIVNVFYGLYFKNDFCVKIINQLLQGGLGGLAAYRKDNSGEAIRYKKTHQIYIGKAVPNSLDAQVKANISEHLGQQLRDAFKAGIAKIINKSAQEVFLDSHYDELDALSFNMSDDDFKTLTAKVGANLPVSEQREAIEGLRVERPAEEGDYRQISAGKVPVPVIAAGEISELNGSVYDHFRIRSPMYNEKEELIKTVKEKFKAVRDIEKLSAMYNYINAEANKRVLNIHEHSVYDSIFFKINTNSWQKMIEEIRNHALTVLFTHTFDRTMENVLEGIKDNSLVLSREDAERIKHALEPYLTNPLFSEHRSNNFFRNLFHSTTAVNKIRTVINYCDVKIKSENVHKTPRLSKMEEL